MDGQLVSDFSGWHIGSTFGYLSVDVQFPSRNSSWFSHTECCSKSVATLWTQRLPPHIPLPSINLCAVIVLGPPCRFELINIPKNMSLLLKYQTLNNLLCFGNAQQIIICIHHNCYLRLWIWKCCVEEVVFWFRTWCFSKFHFNLFNIIFRLWIFRFKRKT